MLATQNHIPLRRIYTIASLLTVFAFSASATIHNVEVEDSEFNPAVLPDVQVGDTIRWFWDNSNALPHTTTSTTIPAGAASWDVEMSSSNPEVLYVVTVAGTYMYECSFHGSMGMTGSFVALGTSALPSFVLEPVQVHHNVEAGLLTVSVDENSNHPMTLALYDIAGHAVHGVAFTGTKTVHVGDLSRGVYLVNIQSPAGIISRKISVR